MAARIDGIAKESAPTQGTFLRSLVASRHWGRMREVFPLFTRRYPATQSTLYMVIFCPLYGQETISKRL